MADRRERVILILDDQMSAGLAKAAGAAALFDRQINTASRHVGSFGSNMDAAGVKLDRFTTRMRSLSAAGTGFDSTSTRVRTFGSDLDTAGSKIDRFSGRLQILVNAGLALGPAMVPIGGVVIPALAGLATQLGFTVAAAGAAVGAFQGIGDAVKALDAAKLEPTAANLAKARKALEDLTPAGRELVAMVDGELQPALRQLRDIGQENLFPGVIDGLEALLTRAPELGRVMAELSAASGSIFSDFGEGLASSEADEFFAFLEREARPTLVSLADAVGNVSAGLAEMMMAFDPLSDEFSRDLVAVTQDFQEWAATLSDSPDFRAFMDYIITTGPMVADTFGSLVSALAALVEAAAPLGGPALQILTSFFDVIARVASSEAGTSLLGIAAAVGAVRTAMTLLGAVRTPFAALSRDMTRVSSSAKQMSTDLLTAARTPRDASAGIVSYATALDKSAKAQDRLRQSARNLAGIAGPLAAIGVASSGVADSFGATNTVTLGLMGTFAGPWGAAIGAGIGALLDMNAAAQETEDRIKAFATTLSESGDLTAQSFESITKAIQADDDLMAWADEAGVSLGQLVSAAIEGEAAILALGQSLQTPDAGNIVASLREVNGMVTEGQAAFEAEADAIREAKIAATGADTIFGAMGASILSMGESAADAAGDLDAVAISLGRLNDTLGLIEGVLAYEEALDRLRESVRENGSFNKGLEAGRTNIRNVAAVAQTAAKRFEDLTAAGKESAAQKVLTTAIGDLRQFARDNPDAQGLIRRLIAGLRDLDQADAKPEADLDPRKFNANQKRVIQALGFLDRQVAKPIADLIDKATGGINGVRDNLNRLDGHTAHTYIINHVRTEGARQSGTPNNPTGGGTITKAHGGPVFGAGTSTSDSIPAMLSNGEYVIRAAAVQRYGLHFFDRLNAMHLANGGYVSRTPIVNVAATEGIDYARLAEAFARAGLGVHVGQIVSHDTTGVMQALDRKVRNAVAIMGAT